MFLEIFAGRACFGDIAVSEELRGWSWRNPPVAPLLNEVKLGVWEISSLYCETRRDIYLRRVLKVKSKPSQSMLKGKAVHSLIVSVLKEFKKLLLMGAGSGSELYISLLDKRKQIIAEILKKIPVNHDFSPKLTQLYNFLVLQFSAEYDRLLSEAPEHVRPRIPEQFSEIISERIVDGSRVGLSSWLMIDVYVPPTAIVEVKTGARREFHKLGLAGYALAIESSERTPINQGQLLYVYLNNGVHLLRKIIEIDDELRREFLEERDRLMEIIYNERDPGLAGSCPRTCPFYYYCRGEEYEEIDS